MEESDGKEAQVRLYRILKFTLEREEYLDVVVDPQERCFMVDMRGGTNLLRVDMGGAVGGPHLHLLCDGCSGRRGSCFVTVFNILSGEISVVC